MSRKKKKKAAERQVQKQGLLFWRKSPWGQLCYGGLGGFSDRFLHLFAFLFNSLGSLLNVAFDLLS
jgi:hypothetical protein